MKQTTSTEKLKNKKPLTDSDFVMCLKDLLRPVLRFLVRFFVPYKVTIETPCELLPNRPVIFAPNHFCFADVPIVGCVTPKRSYTLSATNPLRVSDWLYYILSGVIFVDRKNKEDTAASKQSMIEYLNKGRSIILFPEGTWNLTPNKPILPMKWGIIEIAAKTGAQVIPTVLEYNREQNTCAVCFGFPMLFTPQDDFAKVIISLRDTMATMRWDFWERKGVFSRAQLDMETEQQTLFYSLQEYQLVNWEYESSCIFRPHTPPEEVFAYTQKLIPNKNNAFLLHTKGEFL